MKVSIDAPFYPHKHGEGRFERDRHVHTKPLGSEQRNLYLQMLDVSFQQLIANPLKGKDCSDIRIGYRKLNAGNHVIFYRQTLADMIEIVRILHGHMDIETRLSES